MSDPNFDNNSGAAAYGFFTQRTEVPRNLSAIHNMATSKIGQNGVSNHTTLGAAGSTIPTPPTCTRQLFNECAYNDVAPAEMIEQCKADILKCIYHILMDIRESNKHRRRQGLNKEVLEKVLKLIADDE